jgi:hypothetical protein
VKMVVRLHQPSSLQSETDSTPGANPSQSRLRRLFAELVPPDRGCLKGRGSDPDPAAGGSTPSTLTQWKDGAVLPMPRS